MLFSVGIKNDSKKLNQIEINIGKVDECIF